TTNCPVPPPASSRLPGRVGYPAKLLGGIPICPYGTRWAHEINRRTWHEFANAVCCRSRHRDEIFTRGRPADAWTQQRGGVDAALVWRRGGHIMSMQTTGQEQPRRRGWDWRRGSGRRMTSDRRRQAIGIHAERRSGRDRRSGDPRRETVGRRTPPKGFELLH